MCKSAAEGGQRCAGHARERMALMTGHADDARIGYEQGDIDYATFSIHREAVTDAIVDYASTNEGAFKMRMDLDKAVEIADPNNQYDQGAVDGMRKLLDEGAIRAQINREVENAYRASQGKPPLTTPVPMTFAQQDAAAAVIAQAAAEKATKEADPFGLRAVSGTPAAKDTSSASAARELSTQGGPSRFGATPKPKAERIAQLHEDIDFCDRNGYKADGDFYRRTLAAAEAEPDPEPKRGLLARLRG